MTTSQETEQPFPCPDVATLPVTPALLGNLDMTKELFDKISGLSKALILTGYATGTTPEKLNPLIQDLNEKGIPVFVLSSNRAEEKGIQRRKYEAHVEAAKAGAIHLRDVNINHGLDVAISIQKAINEGKTGEDLAKVITDKYGIPI